MGALRTHLLLLSLIRQDGTAVDDESVGRDLGVQLEPLLGRGDGGEDGETVDARLDVGRRAVLLRQHGLELRDLGPVSAGRNESGKLAAWAQAGRDGPRRSDEGNHRSACGFERISYRRDSKGLRTRRTCSSGSLQALDCTAAESTRQGDGVSLSARVKLRGPVCRAKRCSETHQASSSC
jgi:hypothetical protein